VKKLKNIGNQKMKTNLVTIEDLEEFAFYESGLSADGCLQKLDDYAMKAINRYGRILLKKQKEINIDEIGQQ
jgi:hypothetical protein